MQEGRSCFHSLRRVPHQGYGVVGCSVQSVDWLLSPCSAPSPVKRDATEHVTRLHSCLQPYAPAGTSAVSFVGHAMSRVAARATSAAVVCQVLCLCPQLFKQCRLARGGQVQGAGEKSALPPPASSGRPHVAQRCSIVWMRTRVNGLVLRQRKSSSLLTSVHVRAIPPWLAFLAISPQQRSWTTAICAAALALRICLQPGERVIACDGDVCIAGMDFAVHVP